MQKLTDTDTQIIEALRADARQPNKQMATKIGVSEETVRRHVHAMVKSGALQFDVNVSAEALGMPVSALITVEINSGVDIGLSEIDELVHTVKLYRTVNQARIFEIAAKDNTSVYHVIQHLHGSGIRSAIATFLHTTGDHRI